jgi:hypothetical protein
VKLAVESSSEVEWNWPGSGRGLELAVEWTWTGRRLAMAGTKKPASGATTPPSLGKPSFSSSSSSSSCAL